MSRTRIATIICWIISALALIGLLVWVSVSFIFGGNGIFGGNNGIFGGNNGFNINLGGIESLSGPFESQGTQTADTTDINSIKINWVAGEITVIPHDSSEIRVTEYAQRNLSESERLHMSTSEGTLTIRFHERSTFSTRTPRKNLEVLVPRELSEDMTKLDINTTSGCVTVDSFEANIVDINSVSADIEIKNIVSQATDISTTSGATTAASIRAGSLDISSVSGNITMTEAIVTALDISTTSGRTNASGGFDRVDTSSVSGDTTIRSEAVPSRMNMGTVSGDIDIYIPNTGEITVNHSAVSGRFSSEVPVIMQSGAIYSFSSVSGNTNIHVFR